MSSEFQTRPCSRSSNMALSSSLVLLLSILPSLAPHANTLLTWLAAHGNRFETICSTSNPSASGPRDTLGGRHKRMLSPKRSFVSFEPSVGWLHSLFWYKTQTTMKILGFLRLPFQSIHYVSCLFYCLCCGVLFGRMRLRGHLSFVQYEDRQRQYLPRWLRESVSDLRYFRI